MEVRSSFSFFFIFFLFVPTIKERRGKKVAPSSTQTKANKLTGGDLETLMTLFLRNYCVTSFDLVTCVKLDVIQHQSGSLMTDQIHRLIESTHLI